MHQSCSYGSAGAGEGNLPLYPDRQPLEEREKEQRVSRPPPSIASPNFNHVPHEHEHTQCPEPPLLAKWLVYVPGFARVGFVADISGVPAAFDDFFGSAETSVA